MKNPVRITIPLEAWEECGSPDDAAAYLLATLIINDTRMHLEALAVKDEDGAQIGDSYEQNAKLEAIGNSMDQSNFKTTTINDREYVLIATPFEG